LRSDDPSTSNVGVEERPSLEIYDLGTIEYTKALELQRHYHKKVIEGSQGDVLLACSHEPVFTRGTSTLDEHLYKPVSELEALGFTVVNVERGGSVTYHGPEQAILYPIINLHHHRTDVGWYMRALEETIIRTLADYSLVGIRIAGKTGVWIDDNSKIAFSGTRISRWCTLHGLSLNVLPCSQQFGYVNPCGLGSIRVVSMAELTQRPPAVQDVIARLMSHFMDVFAYARHDLA